jgi:hypothetical protein
MDRLTLPARGTFRSSRRPQKKTRLEHGLIASFASDGAVEAFV